MLSLKINGREHRIDAPADMPLLRVIHDIVGLKGTKYGCGIAQCGACTVSIDGHAQRACVPRVVAAAGHETTTIEVAGNRTVDAVHSAWQSLAVPQCGYCQSGQILAADALA